MQIIKKEFLAEDSGARIVRLEVLSPEIAKRVQAGQFVVLMVSQNGERIPLTVVDTDKKRGTIVLIFQEVGLTTKLLGRLNTGDSLYALVGPLGHPTESKNYGRVILVGGGVGIAEIYPVAKVLRGAGNYITAILGARTKELLILEKELRETSDELCVATDDGSYGKKGLVTDVLQEILNPQPSALHPQLIYAVGPIPMMRGVSLLTKKEGMQTIVSLNALMVDATGMCGCCRVTVNQEVKFSCVDGPEFNAQMVDWDELERRNKIYLDQEKHICNLYKL